MMKSITKKDLGTISEKVEDKRSTIKKIAKHAIASSYEPSDRFDRVAKVLKQPLNIIAKNFDNNLQRVLLAWRLSSCTCFWTPNCICPQSFAWEKLCFSY
eukprot:TRINITY_DN3208_c0_g1_i8.p2 TRINITY_DN3208_c0_g1~~TRINITY_DN3208_c0_g1_i8.p2  ORF type:complete len:100 (-),score=3.15 TRINITY_DN3208_c0_g1_i8:37-336(-)